MRDLRFNYTLSKPADRPTHDTLKHRDLDSPLPEVARELEREFLKPLQEKINSLKQGY